VFHFFSGLFLKMMANLSISALKLVLKNDDWLLDYFKAITCCHCEPACGRQGFRKSE
jgi:hypothetical protein